MKYLFFLCLIFCSLFCFGQLNKRVIDSSVYDKWPFVENPSISGDGNYVFYSVNTRSAGYRTLILLSTNKDWRIELSGVIYGEFSPDNRNAVFLTGNDSLIIVSLGGTSIEYISHVSSFRLIDEHDSGQLAYLRVSPGKELVIRNLLTGVEKVFDSVDNYWFGKNGTAILLRDDLENGHLIGQSLCWTDLNGEKSITVWQGLRLDNLIFDSNENQIAFKAIFKSDTQINNSIWYFKTGNEKANLLVDDGSPGITANYQIANIERFSNDGGRIFFNVKKRNDAKNVNSEMVNVSVWNYKDLVLQTQQALELKDHPYINLLSIVTIRTRQIVQLVHENETVFGSFMTKERSDDILLVEHRNMEGGSGEGNWNPAFTHCTYLESTIDGNRIALDSIEGYAANISPHSKYIIYYDHRHHNFFSYEITSGIRRNITQGIDVSWIGIDANDFILSSHYARGVAGWMDGDSTVLLYDQNDIWEIDPSGHRRSINLTNGFGKKHQITFYLGTGKGYSSGNVASGEEFLLIAFNRRKKENGFYRKTSSESGDPEILSMGPFIYCVPEHPLYLNASEPIKAAHSNAYVVRRESATESPNYFFTKDFNKFTRLSDNRPENEYVWYTTELISWNLPDGCVAQGILYKPGDFDPHKKYPLIFNYYEMLSDRLNEFLVPESSDGEINIPWFVSHEYLIFTPDIHFTIGRIGESTVNAVVSAAKYMSQMPWVDAKRMGIQGFSLGGYETNYIVTHTHIFAAACSGSGASDFISYYGNLTGGGASQEWQFELGAYRIGATLWERPDLYIANSPIFRADKVTTPLLIMATPSDGAVPYSQAIEFFTSLRRLGKKSWMLEYDDCNHGLGGKSSVDFTIRMGQFFDYYLKDAKAPIWMIQGIPADRKGIDSGLSVDSSGRIP